MSFYGFDFGKFKLGLELGNDVYTRQLPLFTNIWRGIFQQNEQWISISGNEYNLYKTTPELLITINRKASMFSNGVFVVKDWKTDEVIENHPLLKLLENPSPLYDRNRWLMQIMIDYCVFGNSINYKKFTLKSRVLEPFPSALIPLPIAEITVKKSGKQFEAVKIDEIIEKYKFNTKNLEYAPNEVIHLKTASDDGIVGLSPFHALQMPISNIRGAYGFRNINITKRGGLGIISPAKMGDAFGGNILNDQHKKEVEKQFTKDYGQFEGQASYKISPVPVDYNHLSYPIKDQMLFEEVSEDWQKIIDAYGLNRNIFSFKDGSKYSNLVEGLRMAYQDSIIPFAEQFCYQLTKDLGLKDAYIELDYSKVPALAENMKESAIVTKTKTDSLKTLVDLGMTLNEARTIIGI